MPIRSPTRPARQALAHRSPSPRAPRNSKPKARTSSASAPASRTSTRPRTSPRTPASRPSASGFTRYTSGRRHRRAQGRHHREVQARQRDRLRAQSRSWYRRGAKQTIYNLCMAVLDPGDEAVIPAPYWVSLSRHGAARRRHAGHAVCAGLAGLQDHAAPARSGHHAEDASVPAEQPGNPTGAAYTRAELRALGDVLRRHPQVIIGTDDMYENIWWGPEPFTSFAHGEPGTLRPHRHDQRRVQEPMR